MSRRHLVMLLALSSIWGASFLFIKVGVRELEPATLILVRVGLGALTLVPVAVAGGRSGARTAAGAPRRVEAARSSMGAAQLRVLPFWLISWAEQDVDSGLTAILQAAAPLSTALLAICDRPQPARDRHPPRRAALGFAGVAALVGLPGGGSSPIRAARRRPRPPPSTRSLRSTADGGSATSSRCSSRPGRCSQRRSSRLPVGIAQAPHHLPGWKVTGSMLALGIVGTAVAYVLYYGLIAGAGASKAILVTYLVPPIAVAYGALLLGEQVRASDARRPRPHPRRGRARNRQHPACAPHGRRCREPAP